MNDKLINRLKQDGDELDHLASKRLAEAGRIPGVTPAALSMLLIHLKKQQRTARASGE